MKTYIQQIDGKWYAYAACEEKYQVYSIGNDSKDAQEAGGQCYVARWTDAGVKYVASASASRNAAYQKARRYGDYNGEIK